MFFNKYRLEDITDKIGDGIHGTPEYDDNGDFYFANGNNLVHGDIVFKNDTKRINEEQYLKNKRNLNKNTLLVSINGTLGNVAKYNNEKIILGKSACYINVKDEYNVDYVYFVFESPKFKKYLQYGANGTTIKNVPLSAIRNYEISIPSKENQDKIVKILKSIEDKIKLNDKINNNLYEEAVALYKDKFKGIGQGKKTIGDYIVPKRGKNLLTRDAIDGDTPVVAGGINPSAYNNQFNTKSPVITISASGANAGYTNLWNIPVWASDCSYIDDSITKNVYFWYIVLKTRQNEIFDAQTGSAQAHIYPRHIADMPIAELDLDEVRNYNVLVEPLFKKIGENKKENEQLSQLRDTLLPKIMNGEIDLNNVEI